MIFKKGSDILQALSKGAKSAVICSYLINPMILKVVLGKDFPYDSLILLSGEKSIEIEESIKTRKYLDSSSIPLMGHSFHSKIYLFEKNNTAGSQIELVISSFNATSPGLSQNLEFWSKAQATIKNVGFDAKNIVELILNNKINIDSVPWTDFCLEDKRQLVVVSALEVLWRLAKNGAGLVPGKPRCIPDRIIASNRFQNYDSILVHTLGNNSLSRALGLMIADAIKQSREVTIRIVSPYHNIEGIKYLHKKCVNLLGNKNVKIEIDLLTVFPPDFSEKFSDPKRQPFASLDQINELSLKDPRVNLKIRLWKKETKLDISELEGTTGSILQNVFLHGKAILVKSEQTCSFLIGSPNLTDAAIGPGPDLNFEVAVWERNRDVAQTVWATLDTLFEICSEVKKADFDAFKIWSNLSKTEYAAQSIEVRGSRDAIDQFLKFSLRKANISQHLYPYEEAPVFFDELNETTFNINIAPGSPRIAKKATIYVSPSNLEDTKTVNVQFTGAELSSNLPLDTSKPDTYSIRIDIESNLIEERRVSIKQNGAKIEVVSYNLPLFDQETEEAYLLVDTKQGPEEIRCNIVKETLWVKRPQQPITNDQGLLRLYSKSSTMNSFGYFRIRCRKRIPQFEVKVACIRPFPISIYFREIENPLAAKILPESISYSLMTADDEEIPAITLATKAISNFPTIQNTLISPALHLNRNRIRIETKVADEHEGYYVVPIEQRTGYSELENGSTSIHMPREMAETVFFGISKNKIALRTNGSGYNHFVVPIIHLFLESDGSNLWLYESQKLELCLKLIESRPTLSPKQGWIISRAPVYIQLSHLDVNEESRKLCEQVELSWSIRSWGQEHKGPAKHKPFTSPVVFTLLPEELQGTQGIKDYLDQFGGYLDFDISYQIQGGLVCKCDRKTVQLISTQEFFETIMRQLWSLIKGREIVLLKDLMPLFHSCLEREIPFDTFSNAAKGDETSRQILVYVYEYSPVVSGDGFLEFSIKRESSDRLINETCKRILDQVYAGFSADENLPKIPKEVLVANLENKVRQLIEPVFVIQGQSGNQRIAPGKIFNKIDPAWKSLI